MQITMIIQRINIFLNSLLLKERSPQKLALSLCIGTYVGFSPFVGMHSLFGFLLAWAFQLNFPVIWIASHIVNNPWTMVPVYSSGYFFGDWLLRGVCGIDSMGMNPAWMGFINGYLTHYIGIRISLCSFLVGGNILGMLLASILYPFVKRLFVRLSMGQRALSS